jgi:hypothetical protein
MFSLGSEEGFFFRNLICNLGVEGDFPPSRNTIDHQPDSNLGGEGGKPPSRKLIPSPSRERVMARAALCKN